MAGKVKRLGQLIAIVVIVIVIISIFKNPPGQTGEDETYPDAIGDGETIVVFEVKVPEWTPNEDIIHVRVDGYYHGPSDGIPMNVNGSNTWIVVFKAPKDNNLRYKYNRNSLGFTTDEEFTLDSDESWREHYIGSDTVYIHDEVIKWRWLSAIPPTVEISPFKSDQLPEREDPFIIGIAILDFYHKGFEYYLTNTLDRLTEEGFKYIGIPYAPSFITSSDPLTFTHDPVNTMSLEELDFFITEAQNRNFGILLAPGLETDPEHFNEVEQGIHREQSDIWYQQLAAEWKAVMVSTAELAEQYQIEIYTPSNQWPFFADHATTDQKSMLNSLIIDAFQSIRTVYSGKISSDYYAEDDIFNYYKELDWIGDKWWWEIADMKETTLTQMKAQAEQIIDDHYDPIYSKYQKPIFLQQLAYSSYDGAAGGNQISTEGPEVGEWFPYNPEYPADFQEQADAFEAVFQAIYDDIRFVGAFSFGYSYWDSYDKAPGIRSKPAEDVWVKWNTVFVNAEQPLAAFSEKSAGVNNSYKREVATLFETKC